jgi:hypothetical protein
MQVIIDLETIIVLVHLYLGQVIDGIVLVMQIYGVEQLELMRLCNDLVILDFIYQNIWSLIH